MAYPKFFITILCRGRNVAYKLQGEYALLNPVGIGILTLFIAAVLWSRLGRGKAYPIKWR